MLEIICSKCKDSKNVNFFRQCKYANGKPYYKSICKKCESLNQINRVKKNGLTDLQIDLKMSWSNYGKYWHIDHIIPQSCLPYSSMEDENFKKCWALENLRPLEAK